MSPARPRAGALWSVLNLRLHRLRLMGGAVLGAAATALIFVELMLYGGDSYEVALFFAALELIGFGLLLITTPWVRSPFLKRSRLQTPTLLFLLTLIWGFAQVLPLPFALPVSPTGWGHAPNRPIISIDAYATLAETLKLAGLGAVALLGVAIGRNDDRAHWVWNTLGVLGGAYVAWALADHLILAPPGAGRGLLMASLGAQNSAACVIAIFIVIAWTALMRAGVGLTHQSLTGDKLQHALLTAAPWAFLMLISLAALSLTGSRGGAVACLAGLIVAAAGMLYGERSNPRAVRLILAVSLVAAIGFVVMIIAAGATGSRLSRLDVGLANRGQILSIYLAELPNAPWTGFGLGTFRRFNAQLIAPGDHAVLWDLGALHNVFLQWVFEGGWPGAILMFAAIAAMLATVLGGLTRRRFGRTWICAALAVSAVVLVQGLVDFGLQSPAIAALWALTLGVAAGVSRPDRTSPASSSD